MKKRAAAILTLMLIATVTVSIGLAAPGDSNDPLVSKSYVDDKFNQVVALLSGASELPVIPSTPNSPASTGASYVPVSTQRGQVLIGGEGTEIILRSGRAFSYCVGENGLVDITSGTEVFHGNELSANHMLIVPRADGRGAVAIEDAWFLVKGGYTLQ